MHVVFRCLTLVFILATAGSAGQCVMAQNTCSSIIKASVSLVNYKHLNQPANKKQMLAQAADEAREAATGCMEILKPSDWKTVSEVFLEVAAQNAADHQAGQRLYNPDAADKAFFALVKMGAAGNTDAAMLRASLDGMEKLFPLLAAHASMNLEVNDNKLAFKCLQNGLFADGLLKQHGRRSVFESTSDYYNYLDGLVYVAYWASEKKAARLYGNELQQKDKATASTYYILYALAKADGEVGNATKLLAEGRQKFPGDELLKMVE